MSALFALPRQFVTDNAGAPLSGARLFFYEAGTSTPKPIYADIDLNTPHTNPVTSDAFGLFPAIWLDTRESNYRVTLTTNALVERWTVEDVGPDPLTRTYLNSVLNGDETEAEASVGATIHDTDYKEGEVLRYAATYDPGVTDDSEAMQTAVNVIGAKGGGEVICELVHKFGTGILMDQHGVILRTRAGASRGTAVAAGGRLFYSGGAGYAIKIDGGTGSVQGIQLLGFRLENQGTGTIGVHVFNAQNCDCAQVHSRDFVNDNWLLECDTNVSTIYNNFRQVSGWTTGKTSIGLRMVEGTAKAVNQCIFENANFGNNLVGIQQDSDCHDNVFDGLELGGCTTGAKIRGRTKFGAANIENCTTGLEMVTGGSASISGSIHFTNNVTDVLNPDNLPLFCSMQGGGSSASVSFNPSNTGMSFRGQIVPATGGIRFSATDGDPVIDRGTQRHIDFQSGNTLFAQDIELTTGKVINHKVSQTTVGAAGGASALPATPTGYLEIKIAGTSRVVPFYAKT